MCSQRSSRATSLLVCEVLHSTRTKKGSFRCSCTAGSSEQLVMGRIELAEIAALTHRLTQSCTANHDSWTESVASPLVSCPLNRATSSICCSQSTSTNQARYNRGPIIEESRILPMSAGFLLTRAAADGPSIKHPARQKPRASGQETLTVCSEALRPSLPDTCGDIMSSLWRPEKLHTSTPPGHVNGAHLSGCPPVPPDRMGPGSVSSCEHQPRSSSVHPELRLVLSRSGGVRLTYKYTSHVRD